jgi:tryptophan-rich sensory protein
MTIAEAEARRLGPPLAAWGAAVAAVTVIGGLATDTTSDRYEQLDTPAWQPPGAVFGPVWTALHVLLAISAALAWRDVRGPRRRLVLGLYGIWVAFAAVPTGTIAAANQREALTAPCRPTWRRPTPGRSPSRRTAARSRTASPGR